jgi:UDP-galactopyranose mutase
MALGFASHLRPVATVYDCMDELSAFLYAPPELREREKELFERADLVFTGGRSLYEAKRACHQRVYLFPSSVDRQHFEAARRRMPEPADQACIPRPRLGFFGVLDERLDRELVAGVAALRPDWHLVMVGPMVKVDPSEFPRRDNIHYLGSRCYADLPAYIAGWDVAVVPFARNDATRYISPTKTPEYLAAGRPVVCTSIKDVVHPYVDLGLARVADDPVSFVEAAEAAMREDAAARIRATDTFLASMSWDATWATMIELIEDVVNERAESGATALKTRWKEAAA